MNINEFGEFIRQQRIKSGYKSQRRFAAVTGISNGTIARIENGIQKPNLETLQALAAHLEGVSVTFLIEKSGYFPIEVINEIKKDIINRIEKVYNDKNTLHSFSASSNSKDSIYQFEPILLPIVQQPFTLPFDTVGFSAVPNLNNYNNKTMFIFYANQEPYIGDRVFNGDMVIVQKIKDEDEIEDSAIYLIRSNSLEFSFSLNKVKKVNTGEIWLFPLNKAYEPLLYKTKEISIIGRVVQAISKL